MKQRDYDSTVARMAGNIAAGYLSHLFDGTLNAEDVAEWSVRLARAIIAETKRTEPEATETAPPAKGQS